MGITELKFGLHIGHKPVEKSIEPPTQIIDLSDGINFCLMQYLTTFRWREITTWSEMKLSVDLESINTLRGSLLILLYNSRNGPYRISAELISWEVSADCPSSRFPSNEGVGATGGARKFNDTIPDRDGSTTSIPGFVSATTSFGLRTCRRPPATRWGLMLE